MDLPLAQTRLEEARNISSKVFGLRSFFPSSDEFHRELDSFETKQLPGHIDTSKVVNTWQISSRCMIERPDKEDHSKVPKGEYEDLLVRVRKITPLKEDPTKQDKDDFVQVLETLSNIICGANIVEDYDIKSNDSDQPLFRLIPQNNQTYTTHPGLSRVLRLGTTDSHGILLHEFSKHSLLSVSRFHSNTTLSASTLNNTMGLGCKDLRTRFIIYQLFQAVSFLHKQGLCLDSLSPSSIMLDDDMWVTLSLGLSNRTLKAATILTNGKNRLIEMKKKELRKSLNCSKNENESEEEFHEITLELCDRLFNQARIPRPPGYYEPLTLKWLSGKISNFEYLLAINLSVGRTMIDPLYHPILPWVTDFTENCFDSSDSPFFGSNCLKIKNKSSLRDLTRTKFRLSKGDTQLDTTYKHSEPPHHIPESLSELTYYIYMARRTPMQVLRRVVRDVFVPEHYPPSMTRIYEWTPDECIPEFYYDSSVFKSYHLPHGLSDLEFPSFLNSPEEFIKYHRSVLESDYVSQNLHLWIDLTFGYCLEGEAAIKHMNVPLKHTLSTNERRGFDTPKINKNPGFVMLFNQPHPKRHINNNKNFIPLYSYQNYQQNIDNDKKIDNIQNSFSSSSSLLDIDDYINLDKLDPAVTSVFAPINSSLNSSTMHHSVTINTYYEEVRKYHQNLSLTGIHPVHHLKSANPPFYLPPPNITSNLNQGVNSVTQTSATGVNQVNAQVGALASNSLSNIVSTSFIASSPYKIKKSLFNPSNEASLARLKQAQKIVFSDDKLATQDVLNLFEQENHYKFYTQTATSIDTSYTLPYVHFETGLSSSLSTKSLNNEANSEEDEELKEKMKEIAQSLYDGLGVGVADVWDAQFTSSLLSSYSFIRKNIDEENEEEKNNSLEIDPLTGLTHAESQTLYKLQSEDIMALGCMISELIVGRGLLTLNDTVAIAHSAIVKKESIMKEKESKIKNHEKKLSNTNFEQNDFYSQFVTSHSGTSSQFQISSTNSNVLFSRFSSKPSSDFDIDIHLPAKLVYKNTTDYYNENFSLSSMDHQYKILHKNTLPLPFRRLILMMIQPHSLLRPSLSEILGSCQLLPISTIINNSINIPSSGGYYHPSVSDSLFKSMLVDCNLIEKDGKYEDQRDQDENTPTTYSSSPTSLSFSTSLSSINTQGRVYPSHQKFHHLRLELLTDHCSPLFPEYFQVAYTLVGLVRLAPTPLEALITLLNRLGELQSLPLDGINLALYHLLDVLGDASPFRWENVTDSLNSSPLNNSHINYSSESYRQSAKLVISNYWKIIDILGVRLGLEATENLLFPQVIKFLSTIPSAEYLADLLHSPLFNVLVTRGGVKVFLKLFLPYLLTFITSGTLFRFILRGRKRKFNEDKLKNTTSSSSTSYYFTPSQDHFEPTPVWSLIESLDNEWIRSATLESIHLVQRAAVISLVSLTESDSLGGGLTARYILPSLLSLIGIPQLAVMGFQGGVVYSTSHEINDQELLEEADNIIKNCVESLKELRRNERKNHENQEQKNEYNENSFSNEFIQQSNNILLPIENFVVNLSHFNAQDMFIIKAIVQIGTKLGELVVCDLILQHLFTITIPDLEQHLVNLNTIILQQATQNQSTLLLNAENQTSSSNFITNNPPSKAYLAYLKDGLSASLMEVILLLNGLLPILTNETTIKYLLQPNKLTGACLPRLLSNFPLFHSFQFLDEVLAQSSLTSTPKKSLDIPLSIEQVRYHTVLLELCRLIISASMISGPESCSDFVLPYVDLFYKNFVLVYGELPIESKAMMKAFELGSEFYLPLVQLIGPEIFYTYVPHLNPRLELWLSSMGGSIPPRSPPLPSNIWPEVASESSSMTVEKKKSLMQWFTGKSSKWMNSLSLTSSSSATSSSTYFTSTTSTPLNNNAPFSSPVVTKTSKSTKNEEEFLSPNMNYYTPQKNSNSIIKAPSYNALNNNADQEMRPIDNSVVKKSIFPSQHLEDIIENGKNNEERREFEDSPMFDPSNLASPLRFPMNDETKRIEKENGDEDDDEYIEIINKKEIEEEDEEPIGLDVDEVDHPNFSSPPHSSIIPSDPLTSHLNTDPEEKKKKEISNSFEDRISTQINSLTPLCSPSFIGKANKDTHSSESINIKDNFISPLTPNDINNTPSSKSKTYTRKLYPLMQHEDQEKHYPFKIYQKLMASNAKPPKISKMSTNRSSASLANLGMNRTGSSNQLSLLSPENSKRVISTYSSSTMTRSSSNANFHNSNTSTTTMITPIKKNPKNFNLPPGPPLFFSDTQGQSGDVCLEEVELKYSEACWLLAGQGRWNIEKEMKDKWKGKTNLFSSLNPLNNNSSLVPTTINMAGTQGAQSTGPKFNVGGLNKFNDWTLPAQLSLTSPKIVLDILNDPSSLINFNLQSVTQWKLEDSTLTSSSTSSSSSSSSSSSPSVPSPAIKFMLANPNETMLLTSSRSGVKIWSLTTHPLQHISTYQNHTNAPHCGSFMKSGQHVMTCDGSIHLWDIETRHPLSIIHTPYSSTSSISYYSSTYPNNESNINEFYQGSGQFTFATTINSRSGVHPTIGAMGDEQILATAGDTICFYDVRCNYHHISAIRMAKMNEGKKFYDDNDSLYSNHSSSSYNTTSSYSGVFSNSYHAAPPLSKVAEWSLPSVSSNFTSSSFISSSITEQGVQLTYATTCDNYVVAGSASGALYVIEKRMGRVLSSWQAHESPIVKINMLSDHHFLAVSEKGASIWEYIPTTSCLSSAPSSLTPSSLAASTEIFLSSLVPSCGGEVKKILSLKPTTHDSTFNTNSLIFSSFDNYASPNALNSFNLSPNAIKYNFDLGIGGKPQHVLYCFSANRLNHSLLPNFQFSYKDHVQLSSNSSVLNNTINNNNHLYSNASATLASGVGIVSNLDCEEVKFSQQYIYDRKSNRLTRHRLSTSAATLLPLRQLLLIGTEDGLVRVVN